MYFEEWIQFCEVEIRPGAFRMRRDVHILYKPRPRGEETVVLTAGIRSFRLKNIVLEREQGPQWGWHLCAKTVQ